MNIRPASLNDIPWIIEQLKLFSAFAGTKRPVFEDTPQSQTMIKILIESHVVLLADKEVVGPVGLIIGILGPHSFNPDITVLNEIAWWVSEEHRASRAAPMLLDAFTEIGKEKADWVTMSLQTQSPIDPKHLLKRGYASNEHAYLLEMN